MLSIYTLKSASDACQYYQKGDYYTEAGTDGHSQWFGKGAEALGLQGPVDFSVFKGLLKGHFPDGTMMHQTQHNQYHRPGYDLTFSAPKSVSILALIGENKEILQAYRGSVTEVLTKIEKKYGSCRNKIEGVIHIENTGNMLFGVFEHADTRAGDPGLHHHCVLMNMTKRLDGEWRTLYADEIYTDKLLNGMEQRSILARKLLTLGYALRFGEKGTFEIEAIPQPLVDFFSKRHEEIEIWLKEHHLSGGAAAKVANFQTRAPKQKSDPNFRQERWVTELLKAGFTISDLNKIYQDAKEGGPITLPDLFVMAESSIENAISHLSERKSFFTIPELMKSAKMMSLLPSSDGDFLKVIEDKIKNKSLIYVAEKRLTTPANMALDDKNSHNMQQSKDSVVNIMAGWIFDKVHCSKLKTETQQGALRFLLTTKDQQVLVTTNSKPLLNESLKVFNTLCQNQCYYPRFLTERASMVDYLKQKLKSDKVMTIEGFILSCEARHQKQNLNPNIIERWNQRFRVREARDIWVIHGDVSFSQVNRLQQWSKTFGARLIFTQSNYQDISALSSLSGQGISQYHLSAPQYYKEELKVKDSLIKNLNRMEAEQLLHNNADYQGRLDLAIQYSLSERSLPLMLTLTNNERLALNAQVRTGLKEKQYLTGNSATFSILQALSFTQAEKSQPQSYQPGDMIRFTVEAPPRFLQKYRTQAVHYCEVLSVDLESNLITLFDNQNKQQLPWNPTIAKNLKQVDVFRVEKRELMVGDTLVWTRTLKDLHDKTLHRIKNQSVLVLSIDNDTAIVRLQNGQTTVLETQDLKQQHWDHGYALMLKNIDINKTEDSVLVLQSNKIDHKIIHSVQELLEHSDEHKKALTIICDDFEKVKQVIDANGIGHLGVNQIEAPYVRFEALSEHQGTVTQQIFHGLQEAYLKARQLNPEFLPKNLANTEPERHYSPEFRLACDTVDKVCLYHSEREAVLNLKTLTLEAAQLGGLKTPIELINEAFNFAITKGWLVVLPCKTSDETFVATRHTILLEKLCIKNMKMGKSQHHPIISPDAPALKIIQTQSTFTRGQKKAIQLVLTSPDRFAAVQGIAGAGKTTALKEINQQCLAVGFKTLVLANTGSAKNQAKHSSGIEAMTTAQFLTRTETLLATNVDKAKQDFGGNRLIILDEASMVSTQEMFRLQTVVEKLDVRLRWVGDVKQIGAIGGGEPFRDALLYGITQTSMTENVRLNDATALAAMKSAYAGDMAKTLNLLKDSIEEIPNKTEALQNIVDVYFLMRDIKKIEPLVITPLNEDRRFVNNSIRERRIEQKELTGTALETSVYLSTDRREIDKKSIDAYHSTDIVRFSTNHPRLGIKSGDYLEVLNIDTKHHRLHLQFDNGKTIYWSPKNIEKPSDIEIYRQEKRALLQNDIIIFKRNNEAQGIFNGDKASILNIKDTHITVLLENNQTVTLDLSQKQNQHLDYGYALTPYAAQGRDVKYVIAYGEGPKPYTKKTSELKTGDIIAVPGACQEVNNPLSPETSKVGEVTSVERKHLTMRVGGHLSTIIVNKNQDWEYFPPFEQRKDHELPLSTSQQSFIVQITRGDWLYLVVPYIPDFQKTLEKHQRTKESVLSHLDSNWQQLNQSINRLVENISGKFDKENKNQLPSEKAPEPQSFTLQKNTKHANKNHVNIDVQALKEHLESDVLGFATRWLGSPKKTSGPEARWPGALTLQYRGRKAGMWKRWSTGEGGQDLISLYMAAHGVDWKTAIRELAENCGLQNNKNFKERVYKVKVQERDLTAENASQEIRINRAREQYGKSGSIKGTLAEKYCRTFRGIDGALPSSFRYNPGIRHLDTKKLTPALIAPIHDKDNRMTGIVRIFLNSDGSKLKEAYTDEQGKMQTATDTANLGVSSNSAVIVQKGDSGTLWIAEGVETALSVAKAVPDQAVVASLSVSQIKNVPLSNNIQTVVICADHDPLSSNTKGNIIDAVERYLSVGKKVFIAMPPKIPAGMKKCDFNDLLKQEGISKVKEVLDTRVEIKSAELLKNQNVSLSADLGKIREIERSKSEATQKPAGFSVEKFLGQ